MGSVGEEGGDRLICELVGKVRELGGGGVLLLWEHLLPKASESVQACACLIHG